MSQEGPRLFASVHAMRVTMLVMSLGAAVALADAGKAPLKSDAVTAERPASGEYFGLYLMGKKVGHLFVNLTGTGETVTAVNEMHFKANVGSRVSERNMKDTRIYEAKPKGRLLSFVVEQTGDGGDQTLEGTATPTGMRVLRKRPGQPNEVINIKASKEVVEDADQVRVALKRKANVEGVITDGTDLDQYKVTTTLGPTETRTLGGVPVKLRQAVTLSEKEKVPTEAFVDDKGRMVELHFGPNMTARAEPAEVAKRLDTVEVFGLTRITLPKPLPASAFDVPGGVTMVMQGLPEKFQVNSYRQNFKPLPNGAVEVTLSAAPPAKKNPRPLADPNGGANLKSTIIVEADNPDIKALAKKIIGDEKDAYTAAKKISRWVNQNLVKDYGSSSDRAADILKTMKGDCTEHSLLTTALLRAAGIPAKRIDGVVYMLNDDHVPALYWHEWVEAWVGEWTQLDPTFGEDVVKATHFSVGEEGNAEITPLFGSLKVTDVLEKKKL